VAEETGLIGRLGLWAIETATKQAAEWRRAGVDVRVAVNLSSRQLCEPSLIGDVERAIADAGIAPSALTLEVTESVLMDDSGRSVEVLHRLRDLGIRIALDDFGTGYSSLAYLTQLPLDVLKLDRSFVAALDEDGPNAAVTAAIVSMARALDLEVVAEGVELESERLTLLDLGCVIGQGYLFARPGPAEDIGSFASGRPSRLVRG
jgi:cyclic di-GMP phosphodiesterase Gmr